MTTMVLSPGKDADSGSSPAVAVSVRPSLLVVDDEVIIALDLSQQLENAGFDVVGPALSVDEALQALEQAGSCDAAVIDVNLGHETAEPIARELMARSIPFVVVSGYSRFQHPEIFRAAPSLSKPVAVKALVAQLKRLLQS